MNLIKLGKRSLLVILAVAVVMTFSFTGMAFATTYTDTKGTITSDSGANVRSDAGTSYSIVMTLAKGTVVEVTKSKKGDDDYTWYKIKYDSKTGWVRSDLIKITKNESSSTSSSTVKTYTNTKGTITAENGAYVRKGAGTNYSEVMLLAKDTVVTVKKSKKASDGYRWYKIKYDGKSGWVRGDLIKIKKKSSSSSGKSYTDTIGTVKASSGANMRKGAGTSYDIIISLPKSTVVTVTYSKKASDGYTWYKVKYDGKKGWIKGTLLKISKKESSKPSTMTDEEFVKYLKDQGFPKAYRKLLIKLHKQHPTWVFKAAVTGLDWDTVIDKESANGVSTVNYVYPLYYRSTEEGAYNKETKKYVSYDSGGWYSASRVTVRYYMDPRNFLNEDGIFQFLTHSFDSSTQSKANLKKMVSGTFLDGEYPKVDGEKVSFKTYSDAIYYAGKKKGVNPYVIASIIIQEQGTQGKGGCISGKVKGYEGYFNFFNIGAYRTSSMSAVERGVWYASQEGSYSRPWNTRYKSIRGGAEFYAKEYINTNKNTLYFKKWNVMNGESMVGKYQYMSNAMGAAQEAYQLKKAYDSMGEAALTFEIPVYKNMPSNACPRPTESSPTSLAEEKAIEEAKALEKKNAKIQAGVERINISGKSSIITKENGKRCIQLVWTRSVTGYKVDYYEIYRSTYKNEGYSDKPLYTTKFGTTRKYVNTKKLTEGTKYYYKIRGVRVLTDYYGNETLVYTNWSNIMSRKY